MWTGALVVVLVASTPCGYDNRYVKVSAVNEWGEPINALYRTGNSTTVLPAMVMLDACISSIHIEVVGTGETLRAEVMRRLDGQTEAVAEREGIGSLWIASAFGEFAWVLPGWRDPERAWGGGGVRLQGWRHYIQFDLAVKATSFSTYIAETPIALDATIGFPLEFKLRGWDLRGTIGLGVWSFFCPTVQPSVMARYGRLALQANFGFHLYPAFFTSEVERPAMQIDVPFSNYVFWSGSLSVGIRL